MNVMKEKQGKLLRRHLRVRRRVEGTAERPRLVGHRSLRHIQVQLIDDIAGKTLTSISSLAKELKPKLKGTPNVAASKAIGTEIAARAKALGVKKVVFDRGGYRYHGRVK